MSGRITTHVLDTSMGRPAVGLGIELWRLEEGHRVLLTTAAANADGRVDTPLLQGEDFCEGVYEIVFAAGDYFRRNGQVPDEILLFDRIPIRFTVRDASSHYHIPLLAAPGGYSTYRGS